MATISSSSLPSVRAPMRQTIGKALHLTGALAVVFGSVGFASIAARWIVSGVPHAAASRSTAHSSHPAPPANTTNHSHTGGDPIAVGMGATQSYDGMAITVGQLQIATKHDFVAAPAGQAFAIVTITLANTDPARAVSFNAADFQLDDHSGTLQPEALAALATPLGVGSIPPNSRARGEIAFLVTYPADLYQPDPAIRFVPSPNATLSLAWDVPVAPSMP